MSDPDTVPLTQTTKLRTTNYIQIEFFYRLVTRRRPGRVAPQLQECE